jgi:hypothetical protein
LFEAVSSERSDMPHEFKRGDRVEWNFRGRTVVGKVRKRLTARTEVGGQVVAASKEDPRYVVRSEKSGKETTRRPSALTRLVR